MDTSNKQKFTVVCPFCQTRVDIEKLPAHKIKYHPREMKLPERTEPKPPEESAPRTLPHERSEEKEQVYNAVSITNPSSEEFTSCPICTVRVKTSRLGRHLAKIHPNSKRPYHAPHVQEGNKPAWKANLRVERQGDIESKTSVQKTPYRRTPRGRQPGAIDGSLITSMEGVDITSPQLFQGAKHYVVDESGVLVNSNLLETDQHHSSRRKMAESGSDRTERTTQSPKSEEIGRQIHYLKKKPQENASKQVPSLIKKTTNSIDEIFQKKLEWLKNIGRVGTSSRSIVCPICKVTIPRKKYAKHLAKAHPEKSSQEIRSSSIESGRRKSNIIENVNSSEPPGLMPCPYCTARVKSTRLQKHLAKVHPGKHLLNQRAQKALQVMKNHKGKRQEQNIHEAGLGWKESQVNALEQLRQSFDETRDGSKGLGHMRREGDGKFGSFPLHDDYSDEGDAE